MNQLKLGLALLGFALALLSVAFESRLLGWVAIGILGTSFLLRLALRRKQRENDTGPGSDV